MKKRVATIKLTEQPNESEQPKEGEQPREGELSGQDLDTVTGGIGVPLNQGARGLRGITAGVEPFPAEVPTMNALGAVLGIRGGIFH